MKNKTPIPIAVLAVINFIIAFFTITLTLIILFFLLIILLVGGGFYFSDSDVFIGIGLIFSIFTASAIFSFSIIILSLMMWKGRKIARYLEMVLLVVSYLASIIFILPQAPHLFTLITILFIMLMTYLTFSKKCKKFFRE